MNDTISPELKLRIESVVLDCILKAQHRWGYQKVNFIPEIHYNIKGRVAGRAYWHITGNHWINLNPILLNENVEYVVNQTVPHEVAHLVTYAVYGTRVKPHGTEWRLVMYYFGKEAKRCHNLDTTSVKARRRRSVQRYLIPCSKCGEKLEVTKNLVTKMENGKTYIHRRCGGRIGLAATNGLQVVGSSNIMW